MNNKPLAWIDGELQTLDDLGLLRRLRHRLGAQGAEVEIDGRRVINFGSNDYLSLAADPRLSRAVCDALAGEGSDGLNKRSPGLNRPKRRWCSLPALPRTWE